MSKFNAGKASVLALAAVFAFVLFLFSGQSVMAYTQADFKAFDGVDSTLHANGYTVSSGITATYTSGTGTLSDPVNLTLTGYAPIVTSWFYPAGAYNWVTIGISELPTGFTGTTVYSTGVIRYDRNPGNYEMGTGSTALATTGDAFGYLDYSFAANSVNTKKDGLVKLQVIWTADGPTEYFTIDINSLKLTPDVPVPDVCANIDGVQTSVPDGLHLDAAGLNCVSYQFGGPPPPPPANGQVLGASTTSTGQVLGASTLAGTGSFAENLYIAIMALGGIITFAGIKNFKKASKLA